MVFTGTTAPFAPTHVNPETLTVMEYIANIKDLNHKAGELFKHINMSVSEFEFWKITPCQKAYLICALLSIKVTLLTNGWLKVCGEKIHW